MAPRCETQRQPVALDGNDWKNAGVADHVLELDAVGRLILAEAGDVAGARVLVVDDRDGALCRAALTAGALVSAWCDDLRDEENLPIRPLVRLQDAGQVDVVLWRLPSALGRVEELSETLARLVTVDGRVIAGGRDKHMTPAMNTVLARSFDSVHASLGQQKCRVLHASGPIPGSPTWPRRSTGEGGDILVSHGGVFAAGTVDPGTRLLLTAVADLPYGGGRRAVDLGSGTGLIALQLARTGWDTTAVDTSTLACLSTRATLTENDCRGLVVRSEGLTHFPDDSIHLIVSNPPFHRGTAKDSTPTLDAISDAGRVLRPGGELWLVFNAHLPYLLRLRTLGSTKIILRNPAYLVTRTRMR